MALTAEGDIGGVNGVGDITDMEEGDPGSKLISIVEVDTLGDGTADPVETYRGRSSSLVWAKKQTLLVHPVPSLHSLVRY